MDENKNTPPEQPPQNIPEEIISSTENISAGAETAATQQPQTSNPKPEIIN